MGGRGTESLVGYRRHITLISGSWRGELFSILRSVFGGSALVMVVGLCWTTLSSWVSTSILLQCSLARGFKTVCTPFDRLACFSLRQELVEGMARLLVDLHQGSITLFTDPC